MKTAPAEQPPEPQPEPPSQQAAAEQQGQQQDIHWANLKEAGTLAGMRLLFKIYRLFGRRIFSLLMYPVACYFVCFRTSARQAAKHYLDKHYQSYPESWPRKPGYLQVLLHFKAFAEVILDKLLGWHIGIKPEQIHLGNPTATNELLADERGQLIIGSHFGNLEYCRGFAHKHRNKVINVLLYDRHSSNFVNLMQKETPDSRLHVYQVDEFDIATILKFKEKIDQGEWVFIAGDRIPLTGLERTVNVNFFKDTAPLPIGPYMLAKALACPVRLLFAYRHPQLPADKIYLEVVPFADSVTLSRKNRQAELEQFAQKFADELEKHAKVAPYQWFNFYNFWLDNTATKEQV